MKIPTLLIHFCTTALLLTLFSCSNDSKCTDGILNGDETSIDCGGNCTNCNTCSDGIQNNYETGIDCGGSCEPCNGVWYQKGLLPSIGGRIYFLDEQTGFYWGGNHLFKTQDGGVSWSKSQFPAELQDSIHFYNFFFINQNIFSILRDKESNTLLYRSLDAGNTWELCAWPPLYWSPKHDFSIGFFDSQTGILSINLPDEHDDAQILRTTDSGKTWQLVFHVKQIQPSPFPDGYERFNFYNLKTFASGNAIVLGAHWNFISHDYGLTWEPVINSSMIAPSNINGVQWIGDHFCQMLGATVETPYFFKYYLSNDGANTWTAIVDPQPDTNRKIGVFALTKDTLIFAGTRVFLFDETFGENQNSVKYSYTAISTDGGTSWKQFGIANPNYYSLIDFSIVPGTAYGATTNGELMKIKF